MALVHRSPGHEVHTLNQCALDMMLDHKVCKLVPGADRMIVCPQYEQSADTQSMALNISYGLHDFVSAAFLVIQRKRFIVNKLNPDRQLHKTCLFEQRQHFIVQSDLPARLHGEMIFDAAVNDLLQHLHRPDTVRKKVVIGNPQCLQ